MIRVVRACSGRTLLVSRSDVLCGLGPAPLSPQIKGRSFFHVHILHLSFAKVNKLKPLVPFVLSLFSKELPLIFDLFYFPLLILLASFRVCSFTNPICRVRRCEEMEI